MDFTDKVVLVTGASSGVGAASAVLFAKHNASLALVGRNEDRLRQVAVKCQLANGAEPLLLQYDLTVHDACAAVITKTIAAFGRLDVLVNCAGKIIMSSLFDDTIDSFDEIMNLNLRVPYKLTHLALPYIVKTKGNIVNVIGAKRSIIRHGFLCFGVARAAMDHFTQLASAELATEGVRMNSVQIGSTRTNFLANLALGEEDILSAQQMLADLMPTKKIVEPEEVAKMVVFVASDLCPNIKGAAFCINGGSTLT